MVPEISPRTDRQTHRQTYSSQYFAIAPAGEVTRAKDVLPNIDRTQAAAITPGSDGMVPSAAV